MKLIFLDIDGVLNAHQYCTKAVSNQIERRCVDRLNRILLATDARIVLSSTWRYMIHNGAMTLLGFEYLLRSHGMVAHRLHGITRQDETLDEPRWVQIRDYLKEFPAKHCILDDGDYAFGGRPGVLVNGSLGLTDADADLAIEILQANGPQL